jgi:Baseplate hub gp41
MAANHDQFGRRWQLIYAVGTQGFDLSALHLRFQVSQPSAAVGAPVMPGGCFARVYNLSDATLSKIRSLSPDLEGGGKPVPGSPEGARLILQAGYVTGNYGVIFDGPVIQLRSGKESNVDTFLEINAADWDLPYTFGVVNQTLGPGATPAAQANAAAQAMQPYAPKGQPVTASSANLTGGVLPRGKVMFGMAHDYLREVGNTTGTTFIVQNGTLVALPLTGYLAGEAVQINSATGMVGVPELTQNGLEVTTLLNPKITIGTRIQVNQRDLTSSQLVGVTPEINPGNTRFASFNADGVYRVLSHEFEGDTRGIPWYSKITALSVDPSAAPGSSVQKYG